MNKLTFVLFFVVAPSLFSQKIKDDNLNVYVTHASSLFASDVSDFHHLDLANLRAVFIDPGGQKGQWQALKHGKGKTVDLNRYGVFEGATDVILAWQQQIDGTHWLAAYDWEWVGGSSSHSQIVQVFELRGGKVFITQQIEADSHHGGRAARAILNKQKKTLVVRAVEIDSPKGRCCPTQINVVAFTWTGKSFRRVGSRQIPNPDYEQ
ncbi:MAG TPA: hypothetical protein VN872_04620 [Candidatus Acidoferrum sp.]|nr:hypothetical protein [Candidatus Acidoferrum sp.]